MEGRAYSYPPDTRPFGAVASDVQLAILYGTTALFLTNVSNPHAASRP